MAKQTLVLVDGSYYLFRAYHALPKFTNSSGEPTGAIFGVINMLHKLLDEYQPDYFAVVFDAKGKNFRNDLYPEYKAQRPPIPEDLSPQIGPLHEIIHAEGFPLLVIDDVEADDVIATLARHADESGMKTIISTGDKDLAQIVNENINLINTMTGKRLDPEGVVEKFGVAPDRIIDYLALTGDSVDNIPGVPKVGPKTAAKWIKEYGSLDAVIEHAEQIGGKVGESLRASIGHLDLSRKLVTLKSDLDLGIDFTNLRRSEPDYETLAKCFKHWEFRNWLSRIPEYPGASGTSADNIQPSAEKDYETVLSQESLDKWLEKIKRAELFAFDTETTSLDYMKARIVGVSLAVKANQAAYIPLAHNYPGSPSQLPRDEVLDQLRPLLSSDNIIKLGHNLKYDKNVLLNHGLELNGIGHDSMLESYVLDSTASRHDMDSLALKYLGHTTIHFEDVAGKGAKQLTFDQVPIDSASHYAAEDADVTLQLHEKLWPRLRSEPGLKSLYEQIEIPMISVLSRMERAGVLIDAGMLKQQSRELAEKMAGIEKEAMKQAGQNFNIASPKQIQSILYEKMGLPVLSKTPKGQPSTAESVLQELSHTYELPGLILEHRALSKLKSTYTDRLPGQINDESGRVHTSYHQAVASTGRLSSSDPNLQNIPIRTAEGRRIRQAFIAPTGYTLLAADYSQIELRIMAHLSADKALVEAFSKNEDIHRATAAEIFSENPDKVTPDQRRAAKAINFGLIYGMSPYGLARQLGIDFAEAKDYVERYFERYPAVRQYMEQIRINARESGFVETVFKRRLYLPEINSRNAARRQYAERTAINAPMQGTAADIIKRAMVRIHRQILAKNREISMIMQVHDELVFEIETGAITDFTTEIRNIMTDVPELSVPVIVDIGTGSNWDDAH